MKLAPKEDESDFELMMEDFTEPTERDWQVSSGRVWDKPKRRRSVPIGETSKSYPICFHGKLNHQACGACEFEAPRLLRMLEAR